MASHQKEEGAKKNREETIQTQVVVINGDLGEKGETSTVATVRDHAKLLLQRLPLEVIGLSAVFVIVWGLLLLPIIYFHTEIVSSLPSYLCLSCQLLNRLCS